MADSVITFLVQNLSRLLVEEVNLLSGVKDKITSLSNELKFIDVFLKNSEGKRNDQLVKEVVSQITDVAHQAEDVVDTYIANVTKPRRRDILHKLIYGKGHVMMLLDVNARIENIKGTIDEIYKNKDRYNIQEGEFRSGDTEAAESLRKRRRDVEEEEVVGFEHDSSVVFNQIMEMDSSRNVVSIIGMGGLGKTTLARKIYNDNRVKELFSCCAWGYVSNDFRARELLLSLLQCLLSTSQYKGLFKKKDKARDVINEEELKKKVRECLKGKKYLVVLDDIWKTDVWDEIKGAFPDDDNGSRILMTSRVKEVAYYTSPIPPYYLPFLNKEESWELFSKKVFRGEECPSDLEPLGKSIVESCGGLPLAIVVLAGLVAKKQKSQREWMKIKGHVNWFLTQDNTQVRDILMLSYDNLPRRLKPCFLYFGVYPEDYEIPARELIQLWIAEGLIQPQETGILNPREPEDVADDYLDELVDRSLVQVASRRSDGGVKTCRIHDLLRDLCISEGKADKFFEVCTELNIKTISNPRRLSLHCSTKFYRSAIQCDYSATRSLLCFGTPSHESNDWKFISKSFQLVRVLYSIQRTYPFPSDLKKLIHLRYLRILSAYVEVIPDSICSLWNLETLDVRGSRVQAVFSGLWKLKRLRHLYILGPARLPADMSESENETMWNLQTLSTVAFDSQTVSLVDNGRFPKLRKLGLYHTYLPLKRSKSLSHLSNLRTLKIISASELPLDANAFPSNLTKIALTEFADFDPRIIMNTLGRLNNLQILKMTGVKYYRSDSFDLNCAAGDFPQLQVFQMEKMKVKKWRLEEGAMLHLRCVVIKFCRYLTELPEELWSLTQLREVKVLSPSKELANSLQNVEVKNGCKLIINTKAEDSE